MTGATRTCGSISSRGAPVVRQSLWRGARGSLSRPPLPADAAHAVRHVGADLRHAAAGARQHHRHPVRLGGHRQSGGQEEDRAGARARPADRRAVRHLDRRPDARRSRLRLRLGEAGHRRDPAAHPGHGQARRPGAVLLRADRRAARRDQRGAPEHDARLCAARDQLERPVAALVLAGPADPDGVRALVRLDPDLQELDRQYLGGARCCCAFPPRPWASAARR